MNERIKELAQMSGLAATSNGTLYLLPIGVIHIEHFAELVRQYEREACAKLCESIDAEYNGEDVLATWCAKAIRQRGEK